MSNNPKQKNTPRKREISKHSNTGKNTTADWWQNKDMLSELDARDAAIETGADKGITVDALKKSIATLREKSLENSRHHSFEA